MNILIKSATIIDPESTYHKACLDVLIKDKTITKIAPQLDVPKDCKVIALENLHISPGWFDSSVSFGEPGYEERETIENGLKVASKSGFTSVALNPNTNPVIDSKSDIAFLKAKAKQHATSLYPIGALTTQSNGEHLAELFDLHQAGAVAFFDYKLPIANPNLLKIALQYVNPFNGLVQSFPQESKITGTGIVNEHINSTKLGLKGNPALAETLQIARDLFILEYTGGRLHIPTISTAKSVELIRSAKTKQLDVSCSVAIHNLYFTDDTLKDFNTNIKVLPPLRTQKDIQSLVEGLKDGTIDMVTSDHCPIAIEDKDLEFDHAAYGTIGLETIFGALQTIFSTEKSISLLTKGKRRFGIRSSKIKEGEVADITLFNPSKSYTFSVSDIISKSVNSAFLKTELIGCVYGILSNNKIVLNDGY